MNSFSKPLDDWEEKTSRWFASPKSFLALMTVNTAVLYCFNFIVVHYLPFISSFPPHVDFHNIYLSLMQANLVIFGVMAAGMLVIRMDAIERIREDSAMPSRCNAPNNNEEPVLSEKKQDLINFQRNSRIILAAVFSPSATLFVFILLPRTDNLIAMLFALTPVWFAVWKMIDVMVGEQVIDRQVPVED